MGMKSAGSWRALGWSLVKGARVMQEEFQMSAEENDRLIRALERKPQVAVPEGFAARVTAALPPQKPRRAPRRVGSFIALGSALAATLVMFALAPSAHPDLANFAFDMELLMLVELCGIGWYYGLRREM